MLGVAAEAKKPKLGEVNGKQGAQDVESVKSVGSSQAPDEQRSEEIEADTTGDNNVRSDVTK